MNSIEAALEALKLQKSPNYTKAAKEFNIDRTTLSRPTDRLPSQKPMGTRLSFFFLLSKNGT